MILFSANNFYNPIPSAFKFIEMPINRINQEFNKKEFIPFSKRLSRHIQLGCAYPMMIGGAPLTMLVDIIIGTAETVWVVYKKNDWVNARFVFQAKVIASPTQHLTFLASQLPLMLIFINCSFKLSLLADCTISLANYQIGQILVDLLPDWAQPQDFSIFINGRYSINKRSLILQKWEKFLISQNLKKVEGTLLSPYDQIKNALFEKKSPQTILNVTHISEKEVIAAYKKACLVVHPDKNLNKKEATILFNCVTKAKEILLKNLNYC